MCRARAVRLLTFQRMIVLFGFIFFILFRSFLCTWGLNDRSPAHFLHKECCHPLSFGLIRTLSSDVPRHKSGPRHQNIVPHFMVSDTDSLWTFSGGSPYAVDLFASTAIKAQGHATTCLGHLAVVDGGPGRRLLLRGLRRLGVVTLGACCSWGFILNLQLVHLVI